MTNSETTFTMPLGAQDCAAKASSAQRLLVALISFYRRARAGSVSPCRFYPSCSQYALEAVQVHGATRGSYLATRRILRCNPFGPHGVDLVPEPRKRTNR